jgi:hypothetical protein
MLRVQEKSQALLLEESFARDLRLQKVADLLPVVAIPAAVALWLTSLRGVDLGRMNDLGLASVIGPRFVAALVLLTVSMAVSLFRERLRRPVLLAHVVVLILILYGTIPILDSVPQNQPVYRHIGIAEYIAQHGSVDRNIDAYFNWPGFFILVASLTSLVGFHSTIAIASWAPLAFNLLFLAPLFLFFRVASRSVAATWLCIWLFFCANWVGQDYFSPQAFAYLGYLGIIAVVAAAFWTPRAAEERQLRDSQRAVLLTIVVLAYVAVTASHQLSPYAVTFGLAALVLARAVRVYALPILTAVIAILWFAYSAVPFFKQFLRQQGNSVGSVSESLSTGIGARLSGSPEHLFVVNTRVALALFLWVLVPVGAYLRHRNGLPSKPFLFLAVSAIALAGIQSYGGEIFLRVFLFSLPAVVVFVAATVLLSRLGTVQRGVLFCSVTLAILSLFMFARYGNDRLDYYSQDELTAMERLYQIAPPHSLLLAGNENLPWQFHGYSSYDYQTVDTLGSWTSGSTSARGVRRVADEIVARMRSAGGRDAFLVFARSMEPWAEFQDYRRRGELARIQKAVVRTGLLQAVYRNRDAAIYVLNGRSGR